MTTAFRLRQVWIIARLEMRRAFFSKRALWVYLLALFPSVIFIGHGIDVVIKRKRWTARGVTPAAVMDSVRKGDVAELVLARTGKPIDDRVWTRGRDQTPVRWRHMRFFDGTRRFDLTFKNGLLDSKRSRPLAQSRRGSQRLRGRVPALLSQAGHLLRMPGHLHESLPRRDAG